jgi:hypothetical protein
MTKGIVTANKTRRLALLAALCSSIVAGPAQAFETVDTLIMPSTGYFPAYPQESPPGPTTFWVQGGVMRDSNPVRLSSGANAQAILGTDSKSDTITRYGIGVRHEQRIVGRQSLRLEARADQYNYARFKTLDHLAYAASATWLWELGNDLSGNLGYSTRRTMLDLAEVQALTNDLVVEQHIFGNAAYRLGPSFRIRGGFDRADMSLDNSVFAGDNTTLTAGLDYVTTLGNSLGVEYRQTTGDYVAPQIVGVVVVDNKYKEREIAGVASFTAGQTLRFGGRLGVTDRNHTVLNQRDFRGGTYRVTGEWLPGNKTSLAGAFYRQTRSIVDAAASYVLVRGVQFGPRWAPTQKLVFNLGFVRERREFLGEPAVIVLGAIPRDETLRVLRFGVGWEVQRHFELGLGWDKGSRSSNQVNRDFDYNALMVNLKVGF